MNKRLLQIIILGICRRPDCHQLFQPSEKLSAGNQEDRPAFFFDQEGPG
jgi:hypothetical protein